MLCLVHRAQVGIDAALVLECDHATWSDINETSKVEMQLYRQSQENKNWNVFNEVRITAVIVRPEVARPKTG